MPRDPLPHRYGELVAHGDAGTLGVIDTVPVALAVALLLLHGAGLRILWRRPAGRTSVPPWRAVAFAAGVILATAAVTSPVDHLAHELFVAHMAQHLVLASVAAPLVVLGRPVLVAGVAVGHRAAGALRPVRRAASMARRSPVAVPALAAVHLVPWYLWHVPAAYDLALRSPPVHVLEHLTLVASGAALTWLAVGRVPPLPALAAVAAGMLTMGLIAAVLTFAPEPLYASHAETVHDLGPEQSQQLGGALMWFPGSLAYLVAAGLVAHRLVTPSRRRGGDRPREGADAVAP